MRLVIIGGDAAGMSAASQARRQAPEAEVVVLEKTQDVSYGACGLPYKLPDGQQMDDLRVISAERFRDERKIDVRLGHLVERLDPAAHQVSGSSPAGPFTLAYDRLLIASGAEVARPPIKGLAELWYQGAYPLKTLRDGIRLKEALAGRPRRAIILGCGYIGLETAEGLREQGLEVTMIEALPQILPFLSDAARQQVLQEAERSAVTIRVSTLVRTMDRAKDGSLLLCTDTELLPADLVVVATGVQPCSQLALAAGLQSGASNSIAVDPLLRTSAPDVFAAGDCADAVHAITGDSVWIPLALRANRAGKLAGENMLGGQRPAPPVVGTAVFKFFGLQIARTGLLAFDAEQAGFQPVAAQIVSTTRAHYYPGGGELHVELVADRSSRRLLGATLVGPEAAAHKIDTVAAALHAGLTADQLYEMDLAYAPPFGPSWSPLLTAASRLVSALDQAAR